MVRTTTVIGVMTIITVIQFHSSNGGGRGGCFGGGGEWCCRCDSGRVLRVRPNIHRRCRRRLHCCRRRNIGHWFCFCSRCTGHDRIHRGCCVPLRLHFYRNTVILVVEPLVTTYHRSLSLILSLSTTTTPTNEYE